MQFKIGDKVKYTGLEHYLLPASLRIPHNKTGIVIHNDKNPIPYSGLYFVRFTLPKGKIGWWCKESNLVLPHTKNQQLLFEFCND